MIKRRKCMFLVFILIVFMGGILIMVIQNKGKSLEVKAFDANDYQYYVDNFSTEENLGSISDVEDAIMKAETIWIKLYGESIKKEKPYKAFYDERFEIWLIQGTLKPNMKGGVANILIENNTGKILAVWHEK